MQKPLIPALLLAVLVFFGCGKSTDTPDNVDTWAVSKYLGPTDKDELTALFTGYTFEFNADNQLVVHLPDGSTKAAKWSLLDNNTTLTFGMEDPFAPVNGLLGQWDVEEYSATSIKLKNNPIDASSFDQGQLVQFVKQ